MSLLKKLAEKVLATLQQRGEDNGYDKKAGQVTEERSAVQIAQVFNALTGHNLSTTDAWTFLQVLKLVRLENQIKSGSGDMLDTCTDMVSYSLLKSESALQDYRPAQVMDFVRSHIKPEDVPQLAEEARQDLPFGGFPAAKQIETGNHPVLKENNDNATSHRKGTGRFA